MGSQNLASISGEPMHFTARVLVVEDEPIVGMDIESILAAVGFQVIGPAASAAEALELIHAESVDCALIDYLLTDGDAHDVVARLTDLAVPFAFVTGLSRDALPEAYCDVPTVGKPFVASDLLTCVHTMCRQVRGVNERRASRP